MERVTVIKPTTEDNPILLIAPHGPDDDNTAELTEMIANSLGCWAVINRGFERGEKYDYDKDQADCNNVNHCKEDVVREEFLEPINRAVNSIITQFYDANIFLIHGMSNDVRKLAKDDSLDMVLGYGAGSEKKSSLTCTTDRLNGFIYLLDRHGVNVYKGKAGGKYAANAKKNLNQYYRKWDYNSDVHSMQIEIVKELRTDDMLELTADTLTVVLGEYMEYVNSIQEDTDIPAYFRKGWKSIPENTPEI